MHNKTKTMNKKQFIEKLIKLEACQEARDWAEGKDWTEVYETCERGDWLLWLFARTNDCPVDSPDFRLIKLAAGLCANEVKHLMKDERSVNAVDVTIRYGRGLATSEELSAAHAAASSYATAAAAYATAASSYSAAAAYAAAYAAMQKRTADIVRSVIKLENFNL